jgi:hypothetical protein
MTSSFSILHFLLNNWSRLISCSLKANTHRGDISNTCALENCWKVAEDSNGKTSTNLWKWRNRAIEMHTAGCRQQNVAQQFNVHPSIINLLLSRFWVTRQVTTRRRHRRQLKTAVRRDRCIVTTSRRNRFVSAFKAASELHPTCGVRISDQSIKSRLLWDCQSTCSGTFESLSSSNACCLSNHPSTLDSAATKCSFVYWGVVFMWNVQIY